MRVRLGDGRGRWAMAGALGAGVAAMLYASTVSSQPTVGGSVPQRVRELEARIARLELRLLAMERIIDQGVEPGSVKAFPSGDDDLGYAACDPPVIEDANGRRLLKAGCESHVGNDPCDPAFSVDHEGIKSLRPGCEHVAISAPCSPPYWIDEGGHRVIRRECLDVGY
jgi:hypothetical protein